MTKLGCRSAIVGVSLLALGLPAPAAPGLPGPPTQAPADLTLFLELVVNEQASGQVVPVQLRGGRYWVAASTLRALHVRAEGPPEALVAVDGIAGVTLEYDSLAQRLLLMVPPEWLPGQELGGKAGGLWPGAVTASDGFLLNYDLYASAVGQADANASLWTEQRLFGPWGVLSNNGVYSRSFQGNGEGTYVRYDTRWTWADPDSVRSFTAGDLITGTLPWGSAARLGGFQVARSFNIRPDIVPYPVPQFAGQAAVPSAVDLFINGYRASQENVQAGPFTLNTMPFINGAGEASVVTTDALGRQVRTSTPFYVANTLLKPGTTDYALAGGWLRQDYGVQNFSYGELAASLAYRRGLTDLFTLETRAEATRGLALAGAGMLASLGGWGVANLSLSHSQTDAAQAQQWNWGYQYNAQRFGISVQQTLRDADFRDLGSFGAAAALGTRRQRNTQINLSASMGNWGAVSLAWFDLQGSDGQQTQLAALNYARAINSNNFLALYLTHAPQTGDHNLLLQWTAVLDQWGALSTSHTSNPNHQGYQFQYSRSPPPNGGPGWNLAWAGGGGQQDFRQASGSWRTPWAQLQAGVYGQGNLNSTWFGAAGSVVVMDGGVFAANRIHDAFALISTSGVEGVQLKFENQLIGQTDKNGHLLVTGVNAYYPSRFEIDTLNLPDYMVALKTEQRLVLPAGAGTLLRFEIAKVLAANITLVDEQGQPLPLGMQVLHTGSGNRAVVGWEGKVYLDGLDTENELLVSGANQPNCRVRFKVEAVGAAVLRLGPLVCSRATTFARLEPALSSPAFATGYPP